jgi:predicted nucleic acid-binding protein
MPEIVITDTSCLILLAKINEFELLRTCYPSVVVTEEVAKEFGEALPQWIKIKGSRDKSLQKTLEQLIDIGEASSIALAFEMPDSLLIIDDRIARRLAKSLGFKVTGTLGVIVQAKKRGTIASVKPILVKIAATDFRVSQKLITKILDSSGENQ